jgi:hypothetical protein
VLKINNHHNVYILGAGFSAARGLPLIKDFMITLRDPRTRGYWTTVDQITRSRSG